MKMQPLLTAVSPATFASRWTNATADGIGGSPRGPPEDDIPTGETGCVGLGAEESPLSVGEELAIDHASREAEMDHDLWRLILCEALRSATRDRQTSSLTISIWQSQHNLFVPDRLFQN